MKASAAPRSSLLIGLQATVLTVALLYFGRPVLLPLVVATLLTFLLRPAVHWLERHWIPRFAAVGLMVMMIGSLLLGIGWVLTQQLHDLALNLDNYQGHIREKINGLQQSRVEVLGKMQAIVRDVSGSMQEIAAPPLGHDAASGADHAADAPPSEVAASVPPEPAEERRKPELVQVVPQSNATAVFMSAWELASTPLASISVVVILVIFMLMSYEESRNRLLRLAGQGKLNMTTKTLDDLGRRISRYLQMNALVNGGFGLLVALGLWLIGVDYALLWGFLAGLLRFVPYLGPVIAVLGPFAMSVVQFSGWTQPILAVSWFLLLEVITNAFVEPLTYGRMAGVSPLALLVCATFWSWLWGPMGLVLSVPLTVVLAVIGKNIPRLKVLDILLGEEPALGPQEVFYQRLLAGDAEEAESIFDERLAADGRESVYEQLLMPALILAERDRYQGILDESDKDFVWDNARELIEENPPADVAAQGGARRRIVGCPAQDTADQLALTMLQHVTRSKCDFSVLDPTLMASEKIAGLMKQMPDAVIVSALGPGGSSQVRYLCKRIRQELPQLRIIVARWGYSGDREELLASSRARGADQVVTTLSEACDAVDRVQSLPLSA